MRRLGGLVLLLLLAASAPAAAQSTAGTGLAKLTQAAAAECRQLGRPASACALPLAPSVGDDAVAAYRRSWTHRAVAFQYRLAGGLSLRHGAWLGTHNSFNRYDAGRPTPSGLDSNQQLTLGAQLDADARSLELDVHLVGGVATVCHGQGPEEGNAGCTVERPFADVLSEVVRWMDAHPSQVLLLYLEDALGAEAGYAQVTAALDRQLGARVYRPDRSRAAGNGCVPLPDDVTRRQVAATGARVVVVGSCAAGWAGHVFDFDAVKTEHGSSTGYSPFPACDPSEARAVYDARLVRYFEDSTFVSSALDPSATDAEPDGLTPERVAAMVSCGVNLLGFDQLLPGDGRLAASVWSWRSDAPRAGASGCAVMAAGTSRWHVGRCTRRRAGVPRTGYENALLRASRPGRVVLDLRVGACRSAAGRRAAPGRCGVRQRRAQRSSAA